MMALLLPSQGQRLGLTLSGALGVRFRCRTARGEAGEINEAESWDSSGRGVTRRENRAGRGWVGPGQEGVAWAGAHQGLAVAAGNGAQGVALMEVVDEAHAAAQHGAGA